MLSFMRPAAAWRTEHDTLQLSSQCPQINKDKKLVIQVELLYRSGFGGNVSDFTFCHRPENDISDIMPHHAHATISSCICIIACTPITRYYHFYLYWNWFGDTVAVVVLYYHAACTICQLAEQVSFLFIPLIMYQIHLLSTIIQRG